MKHSHCGNNPPSGRFLSTVRSSVIQTGFQRYERPIYDYTAKYPPCRARCPAGHDIAWALYLAGRGRFDLAHQVFLEDSPFPAITGRVCYHPCEAGCNRGGYDQPLAIQALERICSESGKEISPFSPSYGETIGVIGGGPAGLTCAYHLVRLGYEVKVYDANPQVGGVLAWGIPPYRLPREVLQQELHRLENEGLQFHLNTRIGRDLSFAQVQARHDAVFLGLGLSQPRTLPIPVPEDPRIMAGVDFLRRVNEGGEEGGEQVRDQSPLGFLQAGKVLVIGGGDVAIDAARSAQRLGARVVQLGCLETREEMLAHPAEVEAALQEEVQLRERIGVQRIEVTPEELTVYLAPVQAVYRNPEGEVSYRVDAVPPSTERVDFLIYAVGQQADLSSLPDPLHRGTRLEVDRWGQTALPGVFGGGDLIGVYNVVHAIGSAKRAAIGIDLFLRGWNPEGLEDRIRIGEEGALSMEAYRAWREGKPYPQAVKEVGLEDLNLAFFPPHPREEAGQRPLRERDRSFIEVNLTLLPEAAVSEAKRCFNCGICNLCGNCFLFCPDSSVIQSEDWGFEIDLDHCKGCGVCVEECPRSAMSMLPEREVGDDETSGR